MGGDSVFTITMVDRDPVGWRFHHHHDFGDFNAPLTAEEVAWG